MTITVLMSHTFSGSKQRLEREDCKSHWDHLRILPTTYTNNIYYKSTLTHRKLGRLEC